MSISSAENVKFLEAILTLTSDFDLAISTIDDLRTAGASSLTIPWETWDLALSDIRMLLDAQTEVIRKLTEHCLEVDDLIEKTAAQLNQK